MRSSYKEEDVTFLLKDITGMVQPQPAEERERLIQQGRHYSEMLPIEYVPTEKYMEAYREALRYFAKPTSRAVGTLADKIIEKKQQDIVLVSLARAGTPVGILLKHYLFKKYRIEVQHYSISIIRGRGIDANAMKYLLERYQPGQLLFVDGWIGKGAILYQLKKAISAYEGVSPELAVLADPAYLTELCGTHEDILIPSSCLNSTVTGLVSRTFLREDIIGKNDFHGAVYYGELKDADLSYEFIDTIEREFDITDSKCGFQTDGRESATQQKGANGTNDSKSKNREEGLTGITEVEKIAEQFHISDINFIKPGIGETTRVLLRRVPWKVLIGEGLKKDPALAHILRLAEERNVPIAYYPLSCYKTCGIIRQLADT